MLEGISRSVVDKKPDIRKGADLRCPHCGHGASVGCGQADGLRRFRCKGCGGSFNALTGTDVVRNPGRVPFATNIGDPAVSRIGSIIWVVRDSQRTWEELASIGHIAERQC